MSKSRILTLALLPFTLFAGINTITLKDGRTFSGRFMNGNQDNVTFQDDNGDQYRFRTTEVQSIFFGDVQQQYSNNAPNRQYTPAPVSNGNPVYNGNQGPVQRSDDRFDRGTYRGSVTLLPAGTELSVRTASQISSRQANDGQVFFASVDRDVLDGNGNVAIPRGSNADLVIRSANGGSIRTSSSLVLDVQSVTVNGTRFLINTTDLQRTGREGIGGNKRTAEVVGGTAVLGTLLGAIAGGGRGAAIGALAGAGAGAGVEVLTKGNEVKIPAETILTFRLDQPVNMSPTGY